MTDVSIWLDALAGSHDRLADLIGELDDEGLRSRSYCDGWTIAQVLSHLGSGAEILGRIVDAAVAKEDPPSPDTYPKIWERWNAMGPREVAEAALSTDGEFVEKLEHLGDALDELHFTLFGGVRMDAVGLLAVRLSEHALHTWDVAVALDPRALVDHDAVTLLVDRLTRMMPLFGKPDRADVGRPFAVRVVTTDPDRVFDLEVADTVTLTRVDSTPDRDERAGGAVASSAAVLHLTAEQLLRLAYGRLDPSHAGEVDLDERSTIDTLRKVFPGF